MRKDLQIYLVGKTMGEIVRFANQGSTDIYATLNKFEREYFELSVLSRQILQAEVNKDLKNLRGNLGTGIKDGGELGLRLDGLIKRIGRDKK
jgi:hypothetical protein